MSLGRFVNRWLPPPEVLRMSGLGVDISEQSLKYIGFKPKYSGSSKLSISQNGEIKLPSGILENGEVLDVNRLASALAQIRSQTGTPYIRLSLPEERIYLFQIDIDKDLSISEIRQQVEFRLEENVPLSPRDAYFDFSLAEGKGNEGDKLATITVCAKEVVDKYYEACRLAKVVPLSFEVESAALARAVLPKDDPKTTLLVDFGKSRTGLGIVDEGVLLYTSTIDIGGDDLSASLARNFGDRPEDEFTKLKNEFGLVGGDQANLSIESLLPTMSALKDEIQTRIHYWNNKAGTEQSIDEIIICGGSANLRGITSYFSETLGIKTVLANVWQNAFDPRQSVPDIDLQHSYGYGIAVGLALTSFIE